eukprot:1160002-Pelagomonas_calceolata.AAC.10
MLPDEAELLACLSTYVASPSFASEAPARGACIYMKLPLIARPDRPAPFYRGRLPLVFLNSHEFLLPMSCADAAPVCASDHHPIHLQAWGDEGLYLGLLSCSPGGWGK